MRALEGILAVSVEQAVAAPYCTSRLADAGARVIKIERPEGDFARNYDHVAHGESAYFVWLNRGKELIALDLKKEANLLHRMIAKADIFVQNLAPGAAERAGFGSKTLRERYPRLITCDISGYGDTGPYRDMKAYDLLIQCETGLASITGVPESPGRVGVSVADIACGMYADAAILEALLERERTGKGQGLAVSLFDAIADWMTVPLLHHDYGGKAPQRAGLNHPTIAPYGAYACAGGREIVVAIQNEREWAAFCASVLRQTDLAGHELFNSNTARVANRAALDEIINAVFGGMIRDEAIVRLKQAGIAFGSLNSVADFSSHPQLRRMQVETPSGPVSGPARPALYSSGTFQARAVPVLDEHGAALREEFGE